MPATFGRPAVTGGSPLASDDELDAAVAAARSFTVTDYGATGDGTTNDYTAVMAAIQAAYDAGGGTVHFPTGTYKIASQIVMPNDGGASNPHLTPRQPSIILRGAGGYFSGQVQGTGADGAGGSILLLTYANATYNMAKIVTRGLGSLVVEDLTLKDTTSSAVTPFLYTTNTTLHVNRCAFIGAATSAWAQDAIVLGGTVKPEAKGYPDDYSGADSAFQGYGTVISNCYFNGIRRIVYGRSYCNHTVVRDCFVDKACGTNIVGGACIEYNAALDVVDGQTDDYDTGNIITGNYLNGLGYYYQVKLVRTTRCVVAFNGSPDTQPNLLALVRIEGADDGLGTTQPGTENLVIGNYRGGTSVPHMSEDTDSTRKNQVILGNANLDGNTLIGKVVVDRGSQDAPEIIDPYLSGRITTDGSDPINWTIPNAVTINEAPWSIADANRTYVRVNQGASPAWYFQMPVSVIPNTLNTSTGILTIGDGSTDGTAGIVLNAPTGQVNSVQWKRAGTNTWLFYDAASTGVVYIRDSANSKMHVTLNAGAGAGGGTTELNSALKVVGNVGFYNTTPAAKPTVTGSRGSNAALASLLTALAGLGLITDSSS